METALDPLSGDRQIKTPARHCGAIRTAHVERCTTLILVRFRYHIVTVQGEQEKTLLAEDCQVLAFAGSPKTAEWLDNATAERLLRAMPDANITSEQASDFVRKVEDVFDAIRPHLEQVAR